MTSRTISLRFNKVIMLNIVSGFSSMSKSYVMVTWICRFENQLALSRSLLLSYLCHIYMHLFWCPRFRFALEENNDLRIFNYFPGKILFFFLQSTSKTKENICMNMFISILVWRFFLTSMNTKTNWLKPFFFLRSFFEQWDTGWYIHWYLVLWVRARNFNL